MNELKAEIWVQALLRRCQVAGAQGGVIRKGDVDAGAVLVIVTRLDGTGLLYAPARNMEGERIWTLPLGDVPRPEADLRDYYLRRCEDDRDLWIVEIEDREGRHFLTEPVE